MFYKMYVYPELCETFLILLSFQYIISAAWRVSNGEKKSKSLSLEKTVWAERTSDWIKGKSRVSRLWKTLLTQWVCDDSSAWFQKCDISKMIACLRVIVIYCTKQRVNTHLLFTCHILSSGSAFNPVCVSYFENLLILCPAICGSTISILVNVITSVSRGATSTEANLITPHVCTVCNENYKPA